MTTLLHDLLGPQSIATDLMSRNKKQLFRDLAERFAPIAGCNAETIVEVLAERERLGSTGFGGGVAIPHGKRSEEHTSELQSLMRLSYAVFCLKKKKKTKRN